MQTFSTSCPPYNVPLLFLTHNKFSFNSLHYLHIKGITMGNRMIHSYTNLFMGNLEEETFDSSLLMISSCHESMAMIAFFSLCTSTVAILPIYLDHLPIPCQFHCCGQAWLLHLFPHQAQQPPAKLHFSSCHPPSIKCSIPFSQAIHGRFICKSSQ